MDPFVVFSDEEIIVINKPAGVLSIPDGYDPEKPHVASILQKHYGKLWIVHRLDRDTSGIMILARSLSAHKNLNIQFEHRQVRKIYHAIIVGSPEWQSLSVETPLLTNGDRKHRTIVSPTDGKAARTDFMVIKTTKDFTLIEAQPFTGYTHQIRAHLYSIGSPIFCDPLYLHKQVLGSIEVPKISRLSLHAYSITFIHPSTGETQQILAPYPPDFVDAVQFFK